MWRCGSMYGSEVQENLYCYSPANRIAVANAGQQPGSYMAPYKHVYTGNGYTMTPQSTPQLTAYDQLRRLSRPADGHAAYAPQQLDVAGGTPSFRQGSDSSSTESPVPGLPITPVVSRGNFGPYSGRQSCTPRTQLPPQSHHTPQGQMTMQGPYPGQQRTPSQMYGTAAAYPERPRTAAARMQQPYTLQRTGSMFGFGAGPFASAWQGAYNAQPQQPSPQQQAQSTYGIEQQQQQSYPQHSFTFRGGQYSGSFRGAPPGVSQLSQRPQPEDDSLARIDSAFDYQRYGSFAGDGYLRRHSSVFNGGAKSGFYDQNTHNGGSSLYGMYSFNGNAAGGGGSGGISQYGSLYGQGTQQNPPGSFYGKASSADITGGYEPDDGGFQRYASSFAIPEAKVEQSEFGSAPSAATSPDLGTSFAGENIFSATESPKPYGEYVVMAPSPPRPRRATAPNSSTQSNSTSSDRRTTSRRPSAAAPRRSRQVCIAEISASTCPPSRQSWASAQSSSYDYFAGATQSPTPTTASTQSKSSQEELMRPVRRRASAPVPGTSQAQQQPDAFFFAPRGPSSGVYMPGQQLTSPATIGRRRGTAPGLRFSGAEFV